MKKRLLASLMSLCLIVGLLPTAAFAAEPDTAEGAPQAVVCEVTSGCTLEAGHEGDCVVAPAEGDSSEPGNDLDAQPGGEDGSEPANLACAELAGCVDGSHDPECPLYVAPVEPDAEPEEVPAPVEPTEENTILAPAPVVEDGMSGNCGAEGNESSVTWALTKNEDAEDTYTLTISGDGAMADYASKNATPWADNKENITSAYVGDGITYIGDSAFNGLSKLQEVHIGKDVSSIGADVFSEAAAMEMIELEPENPYLTLQDGILFNAEKTVLIYSPAASTPESYTIPSTVTTIGDGAFIESKNLTSVVIPSSVTKIDRSAFARSGLTSVDIPNSTTEIGRYAFFNTSVTTIKIGNGLKTWEANAFAGNKNLTSVTFADNFVTSGRTDTPNSNNQYSSLAHMISTGSGSFACPNITSVTFGDHSKINEIADFTALPSVQTVTFGANTEIGEIAEGAFKGSSQDKQNNTLKAVNFGANCKIDKIGDSAFTDCSKLTNFGGENLTISQIGDAAFARTGLTKIELIGTTSVGTNAFLDCTSAIVVDLTQASLSTIGESAFGGSNGHFAEGAVIYFIDNDARNKITTTSYKDNVAPIYAVTNGGTFAEDTEFTSGALAIPTKEGSIFAGWYADSNFSGTAVTSPTAGQTYYAKWIELTSADISMQYGGTQAAPTVGGVSLNNWTSADTSIVQIEDGQLKAVGVGKTTITADASLARSGEKLTVNVEVTPRALSFAYTDSGSGSITYNYNGDAPALSQFMSFAWNDEPKTPVTLDEGTQVNYTYTLDTASGGSGSPETYDELPANVGQYSVTLNLIDPNYTFYLTGGDSGTSNTLSITVNVQATGQARAYLASAAPKGEVFTYNGAGIMPVEGVLQAYAEDSTTSDTVEIGQFTISIRGMNDTVFEESSVTVDAGTDLSSLTGLTLPSKPGQYQITASASNDSYYLYKTLVFAIDKATVTIKPNDKTAYVGDEVPTLGTEDYTVTGLVGSDTLTTAPTLSYEGTPDMSTTGTYTIKASGAAANDELYKLVYEDGTLTVSRRSSGGGGGSSSGSTGNVTGSGDDVNIDVSGGTVTAAQMEKAVDKADRGETITIEASSRFSVSLPSSGLQDAADNNNDVTVELKNGEVTLSPEALSAVAEQAGTTVTLTVDPVDTDDLNSRQQAAVGDAPVFDLTIKSGGKTITDFDGGLVTVAIPYELPDGQDPAGVVVWFMDDNGNITACETMYDLRTETVIFTTRHFSKYVIGYEEPMNFTDVPADAYYSDAVKWAVAEGITKGTSDTTFGPDVSCTRAQMVTFLWRQAGAPKATSNNPFTDVQAGSYYYDAVLWAVEQGITSGTSATTFTPDDTVTRAQTVTFLWRQAGAPVVNYAMSFADVDANAYYGEAVRWAVSEGITSGTSDSTFSPDMDCTRAQIVTFLYRDAQ